jgi:hypothetical protein
MSQACGHERQPGVCQQPRAQRHERLLAASTRRPVPRGTHGGRSCSALAWVVLRVFALLVPHRPGALPLLQAFAMAFGPGLSPLGLLSCERLGVGLQPLLRTLHRRLQRGAGTLWMAGGEEATKPAWPVAAWALTACEPAMLRPSRGLWPFGIAPRLQEALMGPATEVIGPGLGGTSAALHASSASPRSRGPRHGWRVAR